MGTTKIRAYAKIEAVCTPQNRWHTSAHAQARDISYRFVKLQHIAENVREWNAKAGLRAERRVWECHADFTDGHLRRRHACDGTDEARPCNVHVRMPVALVGVVHDKLGKVFERPVNIPIQCPQLEQVPSRALCSIA